jgi:Rod binding domain-containing protein
MAVSPPSDIVLDVARAADSAEIAEARTRLVNASAARNAEGAFSLSEVSATTGTRNAASAAATTPVRDKDSFVKFEAMVLRNFVEAMMPKSAEAVYGKGLAGDMWKSMMAEQVANVVAERGGVGIADRVLGDYYMEADRKVPLAGVATGDTRARADVQSMLSTALVQEMQLGLVRSFGEDPAADSGSDRT